MKKSKKILFDFFKKAEDDSDINGSTSAVLDTVHYKKPSDNVMHGLPDKKSNSILRDYFFK